MNPKLPDNLEKARLFLESLPEVQLSRIRSKSRKQEDVELRRKAVQILYGRYKLVPRIIAELINRERTTIRNYLK